MGSSCWRYLPALLGLSLAFSACVQILGDDFEIDDAGANPGTGECSSEPACSACTGCANDGPCQPARLACEQNENCNEFRLCLDQCGGRPDNQQCEQNCEASYPEADRNLFYQWWRCVFCEHCANNCGTGPEC